MSTDLHTLATWAEFAFAGFTLLILLVLTAPYGRHNQRGWGPTLPNRLGWVLMELPAVVGFLWFFSQGAHAGELVPWVLLGLWQLHYVHRAFVFPLRLKTTGKRITWVVVGMGAAFNTLNAYINATWLSEFGGYPTSWLLDPRFVVGAAVFAAGMYVNLEADRRLFALRRPGESGYRIPRGWLYEYVTCPNYLGELLEWVGFAIATWSLPGLAFAVYTAANLGPRAMANHRWYQETFVDYPPQRRALVPFVL
ncbi:MAG: DUF1295 domain-containing protein [Deltaproteobacteria bacterium]|nr:DUF1295 domain-containing protein [Deltaproteobacteria bacterium]